MFLLTDLPEHCQERIMPEPMSGCWLWIGATNTSGYGHLSVKSPHGRIAHRFIFIILRGKIEQGIHLDHLCRTSICVNPLHLEPVTPAENARRGIRNQYSAKTHCPKGHPYSGENLRTYIKKGKTYRQCRTCSVESTKRWRARNGIASTLSPGESCDITGRTYSCADPNTPEHVAFENLRLVDGIIPPKELKAPRQRLCNHCSRPYVYLGGLRWTPSVGQVSGRLKRESHRVPTPLPIRGVIRL
jgi:hypothetical protein